MHHKLSFLRNPRYPLPPAVKALQTQFQPGPMWGVAQTEKPALVRRMGRMRCMGLHGNAWGPADTFPALPFVGGSGDRGGCMGPHRAAWGRMGLHGFVWDVGLGIWDGDMGWGYGTGIWMGGAVLILLTVP